MPRAHDRPSIRDVAAAAGVSYQTVSRVLNDPQLVRAETLRRVQDAIDELGYRPSKAARSLATNDSMTLGVVSVHAALVGPSQMTLAIDEGARERGYSTAAITVRDDNAASLNAAKEHLLGLGIDGVVVIAWSEDSLSLATDFARDIPTVIVAEGQVPPGIARVGRGNRRGSEEAVNALLASGCTSIAHLAGPDDWLEAQARRDAWIEVAGAARGPMVRAGWAAADGYRAVDELLELSSEVDGIFAANDAVAAGAMRRLSELGREIPGSIAVAGYDNTEFAPYLSVPLASVRQPFPEVGSAAIDLLFQLVGGGDPEERIIASTFIWRESAGTPVDGG